jgi:ketosteroid isomerase-like protein
MSTQTQTDTPADVFARLMMTFGAGDFDALRNEVFTKDVVWHNIGGDFRGVDDLLDNYMSKLRDRGFTVERLGILGGKQYAFGFARLSTEQGGKSLDVIDAGAIRVENGRIAEFWSFANSQGALNELLTSK